MATTLVRIQLLSKSGSEFATINPVLLNGEMGIADTGSSQPVAKVGDGVRPWTALPELTPWSLFNWDSHITGDWIFDATQFFGFTPAEVLDIKSAPGLWQSGNDALQAESRVVIAARNSSPTLILRHAEGSSYAAPTPVTNGGVLGQLQFEGSRGAGIAPAVGARIVCWAPENWSAGNSSAYVEIFCVPFGSTLEQSVAQFAAAPTYHKIAVISPAGRATYLQLFQAGVANWALQNPANATHLAWMTGPALDTIPMTLTAAGVLTCSNNIHSQAWLQGDTGVANATFSNALRWNTATYTYGAASLKGARNGYVGLALEVPSVPTFMASSSTSDCGVFLQTPARWAWRDDDTNFSISLPVILPAAAITGTVPTLTWAETDAPADNKIWRVKVDSKAQSFQVGSDAGVYATWLQAARNGNVVDAIALTGTALTFNGAPISVAGHTHSGADITSGTIADARLSANVVLTNDPRLTVFTAVKSGIAPQSGGGTANYLRADGTWTAPPGTSVGAPADPTATIGLVTVNGVANTFMRSDAAPALNQAIAPTWTARHTFGSTIVVNGARTARPAAATYSYIWLGADNAGVAHMALNNSTAPADAKSHDILLDGAGTLSFRCVNDASSDARNWLAVTRSGMSVASLSFGNSLNNATFDFLGSGAARFGGNVANSDASKYLNFAPTTYGNVRVGGSGVNGFVGIELASGLSAAFIGNGTNEGIAVAGDTGKWLIYRKTSTTAGSQYNFTAPSVASQSSRKIKRETGTPNNVRDILARLRPILYRLLDGYDVEQLGLVAEEVHELCPYLSPDGTTVAYDRLAVLLLADWQSRYAHVA